MKIQNIKTNQIHIVDEILNVDNFIVYFTLDKFCFPSSDVIVIDNEPSEKKISEEEYEKLIQKWVESKFGSKKDWENRFLYSDKCSLGFIFTPKFINKFFFNLFKKQLIIEDNSVIESRSKIMFRKINLFKFNKKEYYLIEYSDF